MVKKLCDLAPGELETLVKFLRGEIAEANAQVEWYKRELDHENSVQARITKERDSLRVEVERLRAAIGPPAAGLQVASYPCRVCDSSGRIEGTTSIGGTLPDLDCPKCLGTGKDFSPHHKIRRLESALAASRELYRLLFAECAQCQAELLIMETPPHCVDCRVDEDSEQRWLEAVDAAREAIT